jgi:hypothetical protein
VLSEFTICGKCCNLVDRHFPPFVSYPGKCPPINYDRMYEIYSRRPEFWLFLTNLGVDYNREELLGE